MKFIQVATMTGLYTVTDGEGNEETLFISAIGVTGEGKAVPLVLDIGKMEFIPLSEVISPLEIEEEGLTVQVVWER